MNIQDWEKLSDFNCGYGDFLDIYKKASENFIRKIEISGNLKTSRKWMVSRIKSNMRKRLNIWHANKRSSEQDENLLRDDESVKKSCAKEITKAGRYYEKNKD